MAPRKNTPKKPTFDPGDDLYVRWAKLLAVCEDETAAAIAVGIHELNVPEFLRQAAIHPEAQRIRAETLAFIPDFNDAKSVRDAVLNQLWREAKSGNAATSAAARVSALRAISDITGISNPEDSPKGSQQGGMLFIPVMKMEQWEKACEKAQAALRAKAHE